jgi:hypothetical protein
VLSEFAGVELDQTLTKARSALEMLKPDATKAQGAPAAPGDGTKADAVVGNGASADGLVRATVTGDAAGGRLTGIEINPRALKLASQDLGEHVVEAVNAAFADLLAGGGGPAAADTERLSAQVRQVQDQSLRQMELMSQSISDLMTRLHGGRS